MSDTPKCIRVVARFRGILLTIALLLTVIAGVLTLIEVQSDGPSAPRAFVLSLAMVFWSGWIALCCMVLMVRAIGKLIDRAVTTIVTAVAEQRVVKLAEYLEENGNIRPINGKR